MSCGRPTASASSLLLSGCVRWAADGVRLYSEEFRDSTARDNGNYLHTAIQNHACELPIVFEPSNFASYPEYESELKKLGHMRRYHDKLVDGADWFLVEPKLGADLVAREGLILFPDGQARDYSAFPSRWFCGSADLIVCRDGAITIYDWKTGKSGSAEQLNSLVLMASITYPEYQYHGGLLFVDEDGVREYTWEPTGEELSAHKDGLVWAMQQIERGDKTPHTSSACLNSFCPHLAFCPAHKEAHDELVGDTTLAKTQFAETPSSAEHAGMMAEYISSADRKSKYFKDCLKRYARNGGKIFSPDGKMEWKEIQTTYRTEFRWVKRA